jgi:hypothetical protein
MPYIQQYRRLDMEKHLLELYKKIDTKGDLCYAVYWLMKSFAEYQGISFDKASNALSAADCARFEFYRRVLAPYEDQKIQENGDIE